MDRPSDGRKSRWRIALGVSIAIHVALLALIPQLKWSARFTEPPPAPVVVWLPDWQVPTEIEELEDQIPDEEEAVEAQGTSTEPGATTETPIRESVEPLPSPSGEPRSPIRGSIDWEEDARRTIVRMREEQERENNYMTFAFPFEPIEGLSSRGAGGRENSGQQADERHLPPERDSFGDLIVSYGDGCYLTVGVGSILLEESFRFTNFSAPAGLKCSKPLRVRDDLFSDQKPEYLK